MSLRKDLEDAIQTLLTPLLKQTLGGAASGYLSALDPYSGELVGAKEPEDFKEQLAGRVPAVLYYTDQGSYSVSNAKRRRGDLNIDLHLFLVSGNYRSQVDRTQNTLGTDDPGIYQMLEDVRSKLFGVETDVDGVGWMVPRSEQARVMAPGLTIWEQVYEVPCEAHQPDRDADVSATYDEIRAKVSELNAEVDSGTGDSFSITGTVVTLTDAGAAFDVGMIGARIKIEDSTTADNDGTFVITHVPSATTVKYTNEDGVTEAFSGTWTILDEPQVEADRDFT